ncbi:MAG: NAD-dependent epimerase/dehydratase family protein [Candidatus Aenigmatarchaeota archaeon]
MKILVTGGAGFIGSWLVKELIKDKNKIIVVDNLNVGKRENVHPNAIFIKGDIRKNKIFDKFSQIKEVFHLAALTHVADSIEKPKLSFDVNVCGSMNVLEFCRKNDSKIIFASSAAVYGNLNKKAEENDFCKPISPYGKYKLFIEEQIKAYNEFYDIPYTIFRIFNVYGPGATTGVVKNLVDSVKNNKTFYLYGDGKQKKRFYFC